MANITACARRYIAPINGKLCDWCDGRNTNSGYEPNDKQYEKWVELQASLQAGATGSTSSVGKISRRRSIHAGTEVQSKDIKA